MTVEMVRVGDVLRLERRSVEIDPFVEYRLIGVYSFGKGIFLRDPQPGSDLGNYRFFEIRPDDLVLSNIQAWEGAIGHATEAEAGTIGTHRFLTYVPVDGRIDTSWARYFFLSEAGSPLIERAAPGSVTRNRTLSVDRFEALEIPLPRIDEQRRIAAFLDSARDGAIEARAKVDAAGRVGRAITEGWVDSIVWGERPLVKLGSVAEVNPRSPALGADEPAAFVPMAAVDEITGAITAPEERAAGELANYKQFQRGDVIFARITPCMQNGKSAVFDDARWSSGFGSTEFHVIRPTGSVSARWIHAVVRTRRFRELAAERFTGTAGQQRVPAPFMREVSIPVPDDEAAVLGEVDRIRGHDTALRSLRSRQQALAGALEPSLLNQAFARLA